MTDQPNAQDVPTLDELVTRKLADAETPGAVVEFDPEEAERAGAFVEDAMSEADAREAEEGLDGDAEPIATGRGELIAAARSAD
jgi:hypothetical protein